MAQAVTEIAGVARSRIGREEIDRLLAIGLRNKWYPLCPSHFVTEKPLALRRAGERLVLWRDGAGAVRILEDRCPHRCVPLSAGRSSDRRMVCAYHGFEVEADPQAFATWLDNYTNLEYDASLALNQVYEYAEFNIDWQHSEGPARNKIYAAGLGALYPEIDAAIDDVKAKANPEEFKSAILDLQRMIYEKGPTFLPIVSPYSFTLYQPRVKNIPSGVGSSGLFLNTWWLES